MREGWLLQLLSAGLRYLKDVNNQFHGGGAINFIEMISGVCEVDEAACCR